MNSNFRIFNVSEKANLTSDEYSENPHGMLGNDPEHEPIECQRPI